MGLWNDWNTANTANNTRRMADALEEMNKTPEEKETEGYIAVFVLLVFAVVFGITFPPVGIVMLIIAGIWLIVKLKKRSKYNTEIKRQNQIIAKQNTESNELISRLLAPYPPGKVEAKQKVRDMIPKLIALRDNGSVNSSTFQDYIVDIENGLQEEFKVTKTQISGANNVLEQVSQLKTLKENTAGQIEVNLHGETAEIMEQLVTMKNTGVITDKEYKEFVERLETDIKNDDN